MTGHEMNIIIVAIIFGSMFGIAALFIIARVIKAWIKRNKNSYDEESFERLAKAFVQHRKSTERRLARLETNSDEPINNSEPSKKSMKEDHLRDATQVNPEDEQAQPKTDSGNLRNMLRE